MVVPVPTNTKRRLGKYPSTPVSPVLLTPISFFDFYLRWSSWTSTAEAVRFGWPLCLLVNWLLSFLVYFPIV